MRNGCCCHRSISRGCQAIVGSRRWPSGELDRARRCAGSDAEVSALPGGLCGAVYGIRDFAGSGQFRVVVCSNLLRCGFSLFGDNNDASNI